MAISLKRLIERQIQKALAEGQLSGLAGEGAPLPDRPEEAYSDMATSVAMRIMAEAGALPEEFRLKKLLNAAHETYRAAADKEAKQVAMALIAELQQRYHIAQEARRRFLDQ